LDDLVSKLEDVDFVTRLTVEEYIKILSMSDEEAAEHEKIQKKFRETLKSLVKKRASVSSKDAAAVNRNLDKLR
jgi:hypothetical protein